MPEDKDFRAKIQRIGELVGDLDNIADAEARASAKALVQLVMDLHAAGFERVMEIVAKDGEPGQRVIDNLGGDPLVSSLLVLYNLHPLDFKTRVLKAVESVQPRVRKGGGELEMLVISNGMVRLHLSVTGHGCSSTGKTLKTMVEDALYEAAPDLEQLLIDGLEEQTGAAGFVPLGQLGGVNSTTPVASGLESRARL